MNCRMTREEIDLQVFDGERVLSTEARLHMESCPDCRVHYSESLKAADFLGIIRRYEPEQIDSHELTGAIMKAIDRMDKRLQLNSGRQQPVHALAIVHRILAAASVCLFIVYGVEQYAVVDKVTRLEKQYASIARDPNYRGAAQLITIRKLIEYDASRDWMAPDPEEMKEILPGIRTTYGHFFRSASAIAGIKKLFQHQMDRPKVKSASMSEPDQLNLRK